MSSASASMALGTFPERMYRKFDACDRSVGLDHVETGANAIPGRHDGRHLRNQLDRRVHVGQVLAACVYRREETESADDRTQYVHRPRRLGDVLHRVDQRLRQRAARAQLPFERLELGSIRQPAVQQQMHDFFERRIGYEIVDIVSSIGETPDGPFDVTKFGRSYDDALEAPVDYG